MKNELFEKMIAQEQKENPIKLSIITAVYNRADMISKAIESVLNQWVDGMEHIVIDGGSTDGTLKVLKKYPHLKVISEPDNGIYDAWNKGLHVSRGNYITYLNSDDAWLNNVSKKIFCELDNSENILITNAIVVDQVKGSRNIFRQRYTALKEKEFLSSLINRPPAINAWIIPKAVLISNNGFNSDYKLAADVDFCIRAFLNGSRIKTINIDVYQYLSHPDSLTLHQDRTAKFNYQYENMLVATNLLKTHNQVNSTDIATIKSWLNITCYTLLVHSIILRKPVNMIHQIFRTGLRNNWAFPITFVAYSLNYWFQKIK